MRQQVLLKTKTWRTFLESVPSQFQKQGWRKRGYTERGYRRRFQGSTRPAVKALLALTSAVLFLPVSSLLSGSCWDEKLKNNAIMPNSIEKNNLFSPLPPSVLFKPLIPILEEVGPSTQIFSSIVI